MSKSIFQKGPYLYSAVAPTKRLWHEEWENRANEPSRQGHMGPITMMLSVGQKHYLICLDYAVYLFRSRWLGRDLSPRPVLSVCPVNKPSCDW